MNTYRTATILKPIEFELYHDTQSGDLQYKSWYNYHNATRSTISTSMEDHVVYIGNDVAAYSLFMASKLSKAELLEIYNLFSYLPAPYEIKKPDLVKFVTTISLREYSEKMLTEHGFHGFSKHARSDHTVIKGSRPNDYALIIDISRRGRPLKKSVAEKQDLNSQADAIANLFYSNPIFFCIKIRGEGGVWEPHYVADLLPDIHHYSKSGAEHAVRKSDLTPLQKELVIMALPDAIESV